MKILLIVFLVGICFLSKLCLAEGGTTKISPRVMLNLTLLPQETNLPSLDVVKPINEPRPGLEVMIQTLSGKQSISSDASTPIFIRVSPRGASIRFEWSFK